MRDARRNPVDGMNVSHGGQHNTAVWKLGFEKEIEIVPCKTPVVLGDVVGRVVFTTDLLDSNQEITFCRTPFSSRPAIGAILKEMRDPGKVDCIRRATFVLKRSARS